ncbi:hypothetical protein HAX54_024223 [Datura stramonium]|uniref:Uncharacterized protein n=1 Tax=Datura stramonium TaxID=4076 RepID=A0ABS8S5T2_DATST|nr:hypothetical protein [Datura stramonium]
MYGKHGRSKKGDRKDARGSVCDLRSNLYLGEAQCRSGDADWVIGSTGCRDYALEGSPIGSLSRPNRGTRSSECSLSGE